MVRHSKTFVQETKNRNFKRTLKKAFPHAVLFKLWPRRKQHTSTVGGLCHFSLNLSNETFQVSQSMEKR